MKHWLHNADKHNVEESLGEQKAYSFASKLKPPGANPPCNQKTKLLPK